MKEKMSLIWKDWILPPVLTVIFMAILLKFVFVLVWIPSESMENTIMTGDRLFAWKIFDEEKLERGEILVFESDELELILIKRLIGLPGDDVEIDEEGNVTVNGVELDERYALKTEQERQHFKVPEGRFFFMGDNREYSWDSRYWDEPYIPEEKLIAVSKFRIFPFTKIGIIR